MELFQLSKGFHESLSVNSKKIANQLVSIKGRIGTN
jgi:hypothetical protein